MRNGIVFFVVLLLSVGAFAYTRGWFTVEATAAPDKFEQDKEEYRKKWDARLKVMDEKIDKLTVQANKAEGDAKVKLEKDLVELKTKQKAASERLDEIKAATADKWDDLKQRTGKAFAELEEGFEKAADRLKK